MIANDILIETLASLARTQSAIETGKQLGTDDHTVRDRMAELERVAGGKIYNRGFNKKPLTITPLGHDLINGVGVTMETVTTDEAADTLGIQQNSFVNMISRGIVDFAVKQNGVWQVDKNHLVEFAKTYDKTATNSKKWKPLPGYISTEQARVRLGYAAIASVIKAVKRGEITGEKIGKFWYIDEQSVRLRVAGGKIKRTRRPSRIKKTVTPSPAMSQVIDNATAAIEKAENGMEKMYYTARKTAGKLNRSIQTIHRHLYKNDLFESAKKFDGKWYILKSEVDEIAKDYPTVEEALIANGRRNAQRLAGKRSAKNGEAKQDKGMAAAIAKRQAEQEKHLAWILAGCPK